MCFDTVIIIILKLQRYREMNQSKEKIQNLMLYIADVVSLIVSYLLSGFVWIGVYKGIKDAGYISDVLDREVGSVLIAYILVVLFFNVNRNFIRRGKFEELKYVLKMNVGFAAAFGVILFLRSSDSVLPRGVYVFTVVTNIVLMYLIHLLLKYYLVNIQKNSSKSNKVLLVTTRDRVETVTDKSSQKNDWRRNLKGIVLVDDKSVGEMINDVPIVAAYEDMMDYIRTEVVDEVFINLPYDDGTSLKAFISELEDMGVVVHLSINRLVEFNEFNKTLEMFGDIPVVTFANVFFDDNKLLVKRIIDIFGAIVGILITCVVTVFVAPALLIESPGPLIFKQKRVGRNGRYFDIYKFRSMYKDAEARKKELMDKNEMNGLMFKMTDDPRITKVGKFIRKTSIDELPQFFNVLKGDMSLVGTRPPTVDEFKQYEGHHKRRLSMKPGITGLWQVSGRSDIEDFEEVVKLDLQYIDNWSIGADVKILFKTIGVIFFGKGAK